MSLRGGPKGADVAISRQGVEPFIARLGDTETSPREIPTGPFDFAQGPSE